MKWCRSFCDLWHGISCYVSGDPCGPTTCRGWHHTFSGGCRQVLLVILIDPRQVGQVAKIAGWFPTLAQSVICARQHG
eukprot:4439813-Karenia_brevis.AAC.1